MRKLKLHICFLLFLSFFISCSTKSSNDNGLENSTYLSYDLSGNFYTSDKDFTTLNFVSKGRYPIWLDSKTKIGFHSNSGFDYYIIDASNKDTLNNYDISGYGTFIAGRYSEPLNAFLFAVNQSGKYAIATMTNGGDIRIISDQNNSLFNPVSSGTDEWIYYLENKDGTNNIRRMNSSGSFREQITESVNYSYGNFSVSFDGSYIIAPKTNSEHFFISIINTKTKDERLIDLSFLELAGWTTISKNNESIYFTAGPDRNLYRIDFDGEEFVQLTNNQTLYRALSW